MNRSKYIRVDSHPSLARDSRTGAIININASEMTQARIRKKKWREQQDRLNNLQNEMNEMKMLLKTLIEGKDADNRNNN